MNKVKNKKIIITAIICIILMSIAVAQKQMVTDTFYTIKIGEWISKNGIGNLKSDPFSWIELPYTFPHWLYDFTIFQIYKIAGWTSLYISEIIFSCILGILIFISSYKRSKNEILSGICACISLYSIRQFLVIRAQTVSFSIFILTILFIEEYIKTKKKRYGILLILLSILLVNLHMAAWPFFFVIFLPYIAENMLIVILNIINKHKNKKEKYVNKDRFEFYKIILEKNDNLKELIVIMFICMLTGMLTPTGLSTPYTYLYKYLQGNTTKYIAEYIPANTEFLLNHFLVLFGTILLTYGVNIKLNIKNIFFYLGLIIMYISQIRYFGMYIIIVMPIHVEIVNEVFMIYFPNLLTNTRKFINKIYTPIFIVLFMTLISFKLYKNKLIIPYVNGREVPVDASIWIKENLDYKNIRLYNEYNYGSYLLFQDIPVMIDNRCELYTPEFNKKKDIFSDGVLNIEIGIDVYEYFKEYNIDYAICTINNQMLYTELESDNIHYEKIFPIEEKDKNKNNTFKIYKIHYDEEIEE